MAHHTTTLSLSIGGDVPEWEGEVTVCYGLDGDDVEDITVTHIEGAVVVGSGLTADAETFQGHIESNPYLMGRLWSHAVEEAAEREAERQDRRDERAQELREGR